jgi:hypothetical protein
MIENPSPATYLKISFAASIGLIVGIYLFFFVTLTARHPTSMTGIFPSLPCDAPSSGYTASWVEISAGAVRLWVPPSLRFVPNLPPAIGTSAYWNTPSGSLAVRIEKTSRLAGRWPEVRGRVASAGTHGAGRTCSLLQFDKHAAMVQTSYVESETGGGYYEVFAEIDANADSVIRVTVTGNSVKEQHDGLMIVRSLRFVTAPPPT